jgi:site-specific DNA recombinase
MRWNEPSSWIFSEALAHEPIIDRDTFDQSRALAASRTHGRGPRKRSSPKPYVLRGLLHCGTCGRRMQAQWNNGGPYYRCRYPAEYALISEVDHPKTVYVRQGDITRPLDKWLSTIFDPAHLDQTCALLAAANEADLPGVSHAQKGATRSSRSATADSRSTARPSTPAPTPPSSQSGSAMSNSNAAWPNASS